VIRALPWLLAGLLYSGAASAQLIPPPVVTPGLTWTVAQWNAFFASVLQKGNNLGEIAAAGPAAQAAALANIGACGPLECTINGSLTLTTLGVTGAATFSGVATFTAGVAGTLAGNIIEFNNAATYGNTITLSGSTVPTPLANLIANWAGSSTIAGNTAATAVKMGDSSDNLSMPSGSRDELLVASNYGGTSFDGGRNGVMVQMNWNTASTVSTALAGLVGFNSKVTASASAGGTSTNYLGSIFGANPWADCQTGATFFANCVGAEVDGALQTGASASNFTVFQAVLTSDHATHGVVGDDGYTLVAQTGASAGVRIGFLMGSNSAQFPLDPNGYLFQAEAGENYSTVPSVASGGEDFLQATFSGSGINGGGFAFRTEGASSSPATAIDNVGAIKLGSVYASATATTFTLDTSLFSFGGLATLVSGGSNFTVDDLVDDGYGNVFFVNTVPIVSTSDLTLKYRAEGRTSAPAVSSLNFKSLTRTGAAYGSGLSVTESAWTHAGTTLNIGPSTATVLALGNSGSVTTINGTIKAGSSTGLSCSGTPTSSFASVNGIVTHC